MDLAATDLTGLSLESMLPELITTSIAGMEAGDSMLTLTSNPGEVLQGLHQVALLHFTAGATSTFAPLRIQSMGIVMDDPDVVPALLANDGRVVIVGNAPLLEGTVNGAGLRQLVVYGQVGTNYTLQSRTSHAAGTIWQNRSTITMTNIARTIPAPSPTTPVIFFRLRQ